MKIFKLALLAIVLCFCVAFDYYFHLLKSWSRLKVDLLGQTEHLLIFSHRGFNASQNAGNWKVHPENTPEALKMAFESYDGAEFDVRGFQSKQGLVGGLLHDEYLGIYGQPSIKASDSSWEELRKNARFDSEFARAELQKIWEVPSLQFSYQSEPELASLDRIFALAESSKVAFCELKSVGKEPFAWHGDDLPKAVVSSILKQKASNFCLISFNWFQPLLAKKLAAQAGQYLPTGIDVVDGLAKPQVVYFAKLLGYDFFLPPHDQVTPTLIEACRKNGLGLISWSRFSLAEEERQLKRLSQLYASLPAERKPPSIGVIVNRSSEETRRILED